MQLEAIISIIEPLAPWLLAILAIFAIKLFLMNIKYKNSRYGAISGNSFLKTIFNKGNNGEYLIFRILEKFEGNNKLLTNIYIPKADGTTTEIDVLMINQSGIFVFESKNYSGWIFGDEKGKYWTQSLKDGKKEKFFNPILQNKGHIEALRKKIENSKADAFHSYIVFSVRCELKKVSVESPDVVVVKRDDLKSVLRKQLGKTQKILTDHQVESCYEVLKEFSLSDASVKEKHIRDIQNRLQELKDIK